MCWKCVEQEDGEQADASVSAASGSEPRKAGWLTANRYADWPAWGAEPADESPAVEAPSYSSPTERQ